MNLNEAILSVFYCQQKKHIKANEILDITRDMESCLKLNDQVGFQLFLTMRQQVMIDIDKIDATVQLLIQNMPEDIRTKVNHCISRNTEGYTLETKEEIQVAEITKKIYGLFNRAVTVDCNMNRKIGGKKSYYELADSV